LLQKEDGNHLATASQLIGICFSIFTLPNKQQRKKYTPGNLPDVYDFSGLVFYLQIKLTCCYFVHFPFKFIL